MVITWSWQMFMFTQSLLFKKFLHINCPFLSKINCQERPERQKHADCPPPPLAKELPVSHFKGDSPPNDRKLIDWSCLHIFLDEKMILIIFFLLVWKTEKVIQFCMSFARKMTVIFNEKYDNTRITHFIPCCSLQVLLYPKHCVHFYKNLKIFKIRDWINDQLFQLLFLLNQKVSFLLSFFAQFLNYFFHKLEFTSFRVKTRPRAILPLDNLASLVLARPISIFAFQCVFRRF